MASDIPEIIVIDDSATVRDVLTAQLARIGYTSRIAEDGVRGIEEISRKRPSLVLCDLRMPRMDGLEFMRIIRELHPDLPVIVMSGAGLLDDAISALKLGAWDYVTKPIHEDATLRHAIDKALEKASLLAENKKYRDTLEEANRQLRKSLNMLADDVNAGKQIQNRMLPRNHQMFGRHEFSRELLASTYLSGDFIDAFHIDDRRWGFYLADVAGHGVPSALVTVLVRTFVQRMVANYNHAHDTLVVSPAQLLARLNDILLGEALDKHVSIFFGIIDTVDDTLLFANGGHFPWPLLCDGKDVQQLDNPSIPLGMFTHAQYQEHTLKLPPAMALAVFSDGVLDVLPHKTIAEKLAFLRGVFSRVDITTEQAFASLDLSDRRELPDDVALLLIKGGVR